MLIYLNSDIENRCIISFNNGILLFQNMSKKGADQSPHL